MSDSNPWGATGEENRAAKLTEKEVREIKLALRKGATLDALAEKYHVGRSTIYNIKTGHNWSHVHV